MYGILKEINMYLLSPTLWRTCRVLANEQRIKLLYALFDHPELCVFQLAEAVNISPEHASIHLRALNSRGLIQQRRRKMRLLCSPEANRQLDAAPLLLKSLQLCYEKEIPTEYIIRQATAFTHPRRIEITQTIPGRGATKDYLHEQTQISYSALTRHLKKLSSRKFVTGRRNFIMASIPPDPFSKALLKIVLADGR